MKKFNYLKYNYFYVALKYILKNLIANIIYFSGGIYWLKRFFLNQKVLYVLNYHNFSKYNNYKIKRGSILETGYGKEFEKQIKFLMKHSHSCYPDEFFNTHAPYGINMLITFDDGYKDNFDIALPIIKKYKAKTILFISTHFIGKDKWIWHDKVRYLVCQKKLDLPEAESTLRKLRSGSIPDRFKLAIENNFHSNTTKRLILNWEETSDFLKNGFEIGSHSANHKVLSTLNDKERKYEITESIQTIRNELGIICESLAYPNGGYDETTKKLLKQNGIRYAFTSEKGINEKNQDKLEIKRIGINASDSVPLLLLKLIMYRNK